MRLAAFARGLGAQPTGRGFLAWLLIEDLSRLRPDWSILLLSGANPGLGNVDWSRGRGDGLVDEALLLLRGVATSVRRYGPDVFWSATHLVPFGLPARLPKIVTFHDAVWRDHPETMKTLNRLASRVGERGLFTADRILCNSRFTRDRLAAHWPSLADRAVVMHLAANPHFLMGVDPEPTLAKFRIHTPLILNVDTVEPRKNLGVFLDCADALPEATFVQCGSLGWKVDGVIARARDMPNVRLLDYVDDDDLNALYLAASAAVFPSIYEGFHIPPLDALRLGCPVVVSDIPVHREVLGDAARYAEPHDSSAFVLQLRSVLDDPNETRRLVAAGRERAREFSWRRAAEILADTLEVLVAAETR